MATYDFSQSQLSDFIDESPVFSPEDGDAIISALQKAGVFSASSPGGADAGPHSRGCRGVPPRPAD